MSLIIQEWSLAIRQVQVFHMDVIVMLCFAMQSSNIIKTKCLLINPLGQLTSIGSYWNDPYRRDLYLQRSVFLISEFPNNKCKFKGRDGQFGGLLFRRKVCFSYKPVFIIHGIFGRNVSMSLLEKRIQEVHPSTEVFVSNKYHRLESLEPMWRQVEKIGEELMNFSSKYPEGINLIGYSQGGLIARGVLEKFPDHNVKTFISLSSPQAGQYGTKFLHIVFPNLVKETAYKIFYTTAGQLTSVGNYWNDPHQQELYYNYSVYLPHLNNEIPSRRDPSYTDGIVKLEKFVLIGGPDDEVITPWQSSIFGYYRSDESVSDLKDRKIYTEDYFGLKTLDREGKLEIITLNGVRHLAWRKNLTVIDDYILPHLD